MKIPLVKSFFLLTPLALIFLQCNPQNQHMNKGIFTKADFDRNEYQQHAKLWDYNGIDLVRRSDEVGILGYDNLLCLERVFNSKDTVSYAIRTHAMGCRNPVVIKDTLYLYYDNPGMFTVTTGWYNAKAGNLSNSGCRVPLDDVLNQQKLKAIFGGLYKWDGVNLIKIADDADSAFQAIEDNKENGFFYVPPPGIGVKYRYNIKVLTDKLAQAKNINDTPDYLNNPL